MHRIQRTALVVVLVAAATGCTTTGHFVVPEGSQLYLSNRTEPVAVKDDGTVTATAFGWGHSGFPPARGIPYRLEKDGKVIQQGRLRTKVRVSSFFVPPIWGVFAYPVGFNPNITYNLVTGEQQ